jgi:GNAT superfamily N-acetyltransferase
LLSIRAMTVTDIPFGMRIKQQAGWNQLEADWRRLLELQPDGCFIAELDGNAAGTVTTCRFGAVAWVAMMLVDEQLRGRGIGRGLMNHAIDDLEKKGTQTIRLDATRLGRPLYESLGFAVEATILRQEGTLAPADGPPRETIETAPELLENIATLDRDVCGADRSRLLRRLIDEHPGSLQIELEAGKLSGFLLTRPGSRARRIGPCIGNEHAALRLLADARRRYATESVTLDTSADNPTAGALAASWGLHTTGVLMRMSRGVPAREDFRRLWASAGPEKG